VHGTILKKITDMLNVYYVLSNVPSTLYTLTHLIQPYEATTISVIPYFISLSLRSYSLREHSPDFGSKTY
jgi:hypothetical protein